jgi:hypothetical protein
MLDIIKRYWYLWTKQITVYQYPARGFHDSFWFDGQVAVLGNCQLIAAGDIRIWFKDEPHTHYRDGRAFEEAMRRNLNDETLYKDNVIWENNNWFEIISTEGECVLGDVTFTWEDGIDELIRYYEEKIYD